MGLWVGRLSVPNVVCGVGLLAWACVGHCLRQPAMEGLVKEIGTRWSQGVPCMVLNCFE